MRRTMGGAQRVHDLHRLHLEGHCAVLAEHCAERVQHDARLGQVRRGALYEHVARRQGDLRAPSHVGPLKLQACAELRCTLYKQGALSNGLRLRRG